MQNAHRGAMCCATLALLSCGGEDGSKSSTGGDGAAGESGAIFAPSDAAALDSSGDGAACDVFGQRATCTACIARECCSEGAACAASGDCVALVDCARDCTAVEAGSCRSTCLGNHPNGGAPYNDLAICMGLRCPQDCQVSTP